LGRRGVKSFVLDTGALIALERFDRDLWWRIRAARKRGGRLIVPAAVLAEAWRGGPRSAPLARLLAICEVDRLDEERAKEVGVRLGDRDARDVVDAHVVCCALEHQAAVATSDPRDMESLTAANEHLTLAVV
jgi:predicted nucleic acid-binding protein